MASLSGLMEFSPDLIVEVTSVCDRSCQGCYAPNVISRAGAKELGKTSPGLFLTPETLEVALKNLDTALPITIAFRGGEPSRNPWLSDLLRISALVGQRLFVETHGRWITDPIRGEEEDNHRLIETIRETNAVTKISFDRMHGLTAEQLRTITDLLDGEIIQWCIAITEISEAAFLETRSLCSWIPDSKVIYQQKATSLTSLIRPRLGVIRPNGAIQERPSARDSFLTSTFDGVSRRPA